MIEELESLENCLTLSVDYAKDKDCRCAILNLVYNDTNHIIYETFDKEQIIALDKVFREEEKYRQRLESIDNSNYSEAMKCLEEIIEHGKYLLGQTPNEFGENWTPYWFDEKADNIKQALLKLDFLEDAMDLPTNCFSTLKNRNGNEVTIMRRERYEEYQEQEKVLKIIFEKKVNLEYLRQSQNVREYNSKITIVIDGIKYAKSEARKLTQEEFDNLKRYCNGK